MSLFEGKNRPIHSVIWRCGQHKEVMTRLLELMFFLMIGQVWNQSFASAIPLNFVNFFTPATFTELDSEITPTLAPGFEGCAGKKNGTLLQYPYDCDWYIRCDDHRGPLMRRCEEGRQFNPILQLCDYKEYVNCIASPYPTTSTTTTTTTPSTTSTTTTTTSTTTTPTTTTTTTTTPPPTTTSTTTTTTTEKPEDGPCKGMKNGTLLPYPNDCQRYYRCEDGVAIVHYCLVTRRFNAVLLICDYPENVQCKNYF